MTGEELYQSLKKMTPEQRKGKVLIWDSKDWAYFEVDGNGNEVRAGKATKDTIAYKRAENGDPVVMIG